ncbi:MAG: diguanylate cyclase [Paucimonas sp.]|nr:diguanylate cyclase [Paucimonas sp.]
MTRFSDTGCQIGNLQIFQHANEAAIAPLLADCAVVDVAAGETLTENAGQGTCLYIVLEGALGMAANDTATGDGSVSRIHVGECVGELSVLDEEAGTATVQALEDSRVLVIPSAKLWRIIDESNNVARNLLRLLSFRIRAANAQLRKRQRLGEFYRQLSMADGLTGLQNRAWLNENFPALVGEAQRTDRPLSVVMIDIDHFKRFNDDYGHVLGDSALQTAATVLSTALRPTDFAVRYGGEELMVILPGTDLKSAEMVAQRLCEKMRQSIVFADMRKPLPHITASFGVACLSARQSMEALISAADSALYRAKEAGRDQVAVNG